MDVIHLFPNKWSNVQKHCHTGSGRMQRKMTELHFDENQCDDELKSTVDFYNQLVTERLQKIKGFQ